MPERHDSQIGKNLEERMKEEGKGGLWQVLASLIKLAEVKPGGWKESLEVQRKAAEKDKPNKSGQP